MISMNLCAGRGLCKIQRKEGSAVDNNAINKARGIAISPVNVKCMFEPSPFPSAVVLPFPSYCFVRACKPQSRRARQAFMNACNVTTHVRMLKTKA